MNKKEILMICLIICFIFSISAVSAADVDVNTTDDTILTVQIDDAVSISNDLSSYSLPEDNSIVRGENDVGSFSELQELINNDTTGTISLDKNYTFDSSSDTSLVQGIVISKDIVIEGNGFTIDALSSARIFDISSGSAVKLIGINFVNGGSASVTNGGSIYSNAQGLIIDKCTFDGSYAVKDGGAIYVNSDSCTVANSTFTNNIAGDDGGALYWNGAGGTIYNITCENNKGISSGTSTSKGGSICFTGSNSVIDKSTFKDSSATFNGGALFITGDNVNITNCDFSSCTSDNSAYTGSSNASDDLPYGGAMYILGSNALVDTCTFDDCSAIYGGAIYVLGNSATINNSTFATNDATKDGGAIYISGVKCIVHNSTFTDNVVGDDGGAIYWNGAQGSIYNITCTNNRGTSSGTSTSKGGSICLTGDNVSVDKSTFTDSFATFNGGALFITGDNVNITNCDFSSCTSDNSTYTGSNMTSDDSPSGGAIYIIGENTFVDACTFDDCTAMYGGAIYVFGDSAIINNSIFTNGKVIEDAGAIYIEGTDCKVYDSTFTDNEAGDDGGAIYWKGNDGIIDGCTFDNNIGTSTGNPANPSTSKGGTLSVIGNNVDISNSNFTGGVTKNRGNANTGGAIFITGNYTNIDGCNFNDCRAEGSDGGVIYILGNHIDISNSTFSNSTARAGGAIYIQGVGTFIGGCNFTDTYAKSGSNYNSNNLGGAIYIQGVDTIITHSNFENSHAYNGGMVYMAGDNGVVMHSSLNNGHATNDGGAIYATGSNCTIFESNLTNNYADGNAGGIYWNGGANSHDNTVNGCILANNTAYARSNTNTKGGGAIYWSEGGKDGSVLNSQFINNSVQSNVKADGGAMLWDRSNGALIDNCTFDGNYITTSDTGNVWVQGGALYLRVDDSSTIKNSVFKNSASDKEAGAVYIQSKTLSSSQIISVTNVSFINNTAKAIGQNSFGGGALQLKECNNVMLTNVSFINNTANNGGALAIYLTKGGIQLINCSFDGNNATDDGGSIWANKAFTITNTAISNSTASERGGGMYVSATMTNNNLTFINNTAKNGGGLYLDVAQNLANIVFINNTAEENGGGIYINDKTITVSNANMTGNKAFSGSAIYTTKPLTLRNSYLIENQANSSLNTSYLHYDSSDGSIDLLFEGWDRYINAVYLTGTNKLTVQNVTYWGVDGVMNTGSSSYSSGPTPTPEVRQNFTFRVYDNDGNLLAEGYDITDGEGMIHLNVANIVPSLSPDQYDQIYIEAELTNDDYYVNVEFTTRGPCEINASATNTTYHSNTTISVNVTSGATGNVSVYLNDTFVCNITLGDDSKGSINIDTILEGEFIPAGNHTLTLVYNGNFKFIPCNTTTILEIRKITPTIIINATEDSYCVDVNVTVIDEELNTSIPTGTVTLEIDGRIATIKLVNGTGSTRFAGIPIGNYTLNGDYSGDNNYNSIANSTDVNVTTKQQTVVYIDVDVRDIYWVNETVHINVTVFPNATGNLTLYLNGVPHNLTLVNSTASFDATDLIGGPNHILVTYNGDNDNAPSWGEASFYVIKFNATVEINATNITVGDKEIINFTLPENATGILNVTINGTRHYVEIINGTATLPVYELPVGVYNVTAYFNGDRYYYNATNSTLFTVSRATANITISVDNVTYGNDTVIVVTVPEGVTGNVTLTINETLVVFDPEDLDEGKATFTVENLPAGNYTIEATYNGDGSHAVSTAEANFTIYKADVELEIEVHDIPYGNVEDIIVTVRAKGNAQGNVTITVAGNTTTIVLGEEKTWVLKATQTYEDIEDYEGTATWHIYNLAVGTYPVTATYNGNENFNELTEEASFIVYQINTTLDVDVHDILVWDKESINVTLAENATGNVIININGENHTVPITNGTAQLNLTNLTVGHKVVWVFYDGDRNYTANRTMVEFDVGQRDPLVNVTALNVTVDQEGKITINIPANATGYVILSGNFTKHSIYVDEFTDGVAEITVDDLAVGNYSVHIKYYGDALDNYTVAENDTSFKVGKINTTLSIDVKDIKYSESANITVTVLPGVEGTITIELNDAAGRNITLPIVDGKVNWIVPDLAAGDYTVHAVYNGNDECNINDTESEDFTVSRATPVITIDEAFTDANNSAKVIVHINDTATGTMNITVNGKSYEANISNGVAEFTVDVLPAGDYDITANYYALTDSNYTVADSNLVDGLHVAKVADYPMNITASDIYVGDNTNITVNVPDDATGKVIIELNGTNHTATISQGVAVLDNVSTLKEGVYNVTAYFGNDKYVNKTASTRFVVSKVNATIKVDVENLYVDDTAYINVTVPDDNEGTVTIEINGKSYGPESVTDGVARFVVHNVTYGNKTVAVTYSGTDKYVSNFTTANFTVSKRTPVVNVTNITIVDGKDAVINISGPDDRDGNLVVTVDGVDYAVNMTGGNATLTVEGLSVDNYTVSIVYIENDKYNEGTASGWVNVIAKGTSSIKIDVEDVYYVGQEIIITLTPVNSTGAVNVTINGKEYTITDNKVTIENGLPNGTYVIEAVLAEDDNYYGSSANATFAVVKNNINITVANSTTPDPIVVGTPVTFTAELNESVTGDVVFTINGANYTVHVTDSNVATCEYTPVNNATITVVATFLGNDKYNANVSDAKEFPVSRIPTDINVTVETPVAYGDDAVITVELNETINATVKLIVDDKEYDVAIINGKGGFNASGLNSGDHKVNVTYVGDDKYAGSKNATSFTVDNATLVAEVTAFNVTVEQNTTFVINVTDDFKGNVSIKVGDEVLYNGSVKTLIYADKLPAGDKTATFVFYGDSNYEELTIPNVEFTVSRVAPSINMTIADVTYPNNATAVINVSNAANGTAKVTVKLKGTDKVKVFNGTVSNGVARVNLTGLAGGNYEATVEFITSDDYNGNATTADKFTVLPNNSLIIVNATKIYKVGEDVEIKFTTINSTGLLTIFINGTQYKDPLSPNPNTHEVCIEGLGEGTYTITAVLDGDQNYTGDDTFVTIKVVKNNVTITVNDTTVPATIYVGSPVNFTANLNESVTGDVIFTINGANYTVHITNASVATYEYTPVNNDTIAVVATFMGNDKYNGNVSAQKEFNVSRIPTDINVTVKTPVTYGDDAVITVELNETINTTVKLLVDGKEYDVAVINGKGGFNASGLNSGDHEVNVTYVGDDKYAGSKDSTSFTVDNATLVPEVTAFNVTVEQNTTFVINVTDDFKGNVSIKVGDEVLYNGSVKTLIYADKLPAGDKTATVVFYGDSNYDVLTKDVEFTVSRVAPSINVTIADVTYPDKAVAVINVSNAANGTVKVTVDGKVFNGTVSNGVATVELTNLSAGSKVADVEFFSTDDYNANANASAKFNVYMANSTIIISVDEVYVYNDTIIINLNTTGSDGAVNVTINGKDYNVTNNQIVIAALAAGDYTIIANLAANENYTAATNSTTFKVEKAGTNVTIAVDSVYKVGDDIVINLTTVNATDLTVTINGNNYTVDEDNKVIIPGGLKADEYIVTAVIAGNENYTGSQDNKTFMVVKRDSFIYVDATNTTVDGEVVINVTVPDDAIGYVVVNVNGTNYTINLTAGEDSVTITVSEDGLYNVTATYLGDDKYLSSNNTTTFKVDKIPSFVNITVNNDGIFANGSDVDIVINAPSDITGKVNVTVWDMDRNINTTYTVYVNEGEGTLHLETPRIGNYNVTGVYLENRKYLESRNYTLFEVYNTAKELYVLSDDIFVKQNETVFVNIPGEHVGGKVTIIISNTSGEVIRNETVPITSYTSTYDYSYAKWTLPVLDAGHYDVKAIYIETDGLKTYVYEGNNSFNVIKLASEIKIKEINNITVGENVTIELELDPSDATGNISVFVNGVEYNTTTDNLTIIIPNLNVDEYDVQAFYYGDKNYNESNASSSFKVDKIIVPMSINVTNSKVGEVEQINVTVGNNATGQILLDIGGNHYYANITDGVARFNITGLKADEYNVTATYIENNKYYGNTTNATVTVSKSNSTITVKVDNITLNDVAAVNITVITGASGNVTITIGNEYNKTVGIVNGTFSVIVPDLTVGNKTVNVTYNGNDQFLPSSNSTNFTVKPADTSMIIDVENITYGDVETVIVYINANGNVTIKLNGETYDTKEISGGKVVFPIEGLNAGNYTVEAIYNGDGNNAPSSAEANFTVEKADPIITIEVEDIIYGDVEHIIVHVNAEGNVTIKVNGEVVDELTLENGNAVLRASVLDSYNGNASVDVYNLPVGNYPVEVIFNGNENYNTATETADFDVLKASTNVSVEVNPTMEVDQTQVMNITINNTNATGEVIINVGGKNYTRNLTGGKANFTIEGLAAGNHTIVVIYEGDRNLTGNWTSVNIEVTKLTPEITVNATNITVGDKTLIEVTAPSDATRPVLVDVDGVGYYVNLTDGKGSIEVPITKEGTYNVTARYLGDDRYTNASANATFKASKVSSSVNVTVENITFGDNAVIEVSVPEDATGNVTVTVDGKDYNVSVSDGKGTLVVPGLKVGNYTVDVKYLGDDKYEESTNSVNFTVSKAEIDEIRVIDQNNGTITIVVGDNATGNVTVKVGNETYNATVVDGIATVDLVNNTPGTYDVEVTYSGDDSHEPATGDGTATIPKLDTPISVEVSDINVDDVARINVTVPENATGEVRIEINGEEYFAPIEDGVARFEVENLTAGVKTVYVSYAGDDNYTGNHTSANFTVNKVAPEITVTATNTTVGDKTLIEVTAPSDATMPALVDVDGVGYYVNLTDGKGSIEVPISKDGTHDVTATYPGDDKYVEASANTTFEASKVPSTINVTAENITVGDKAVINVSVPEDVCGNVTVTVDGKNYTVFVSGGHGTLAIPDLEAGEYTVDAIFAGCKKYEPSNATTKFTVSKEDSDITVVDQGNGTVVVIVGDNATGNVTVKVGNNTYNATVVDGKAVVELNNETPGVHDIEVIYSGDDTHNNATGDGTATIPKLDTPISVEVSDIYVDDVARINVTVPENATGEIRIEINGKEYFAPIEDGVARFEVENLTAGVKTVYASYAGDDNYAGNHTSANFTVNKVTPEITLDAEVDGDEMIIHVTAPNDATGPVLIDVNGVGYYVNLTDGEGQLSLPDLAGGNYDISAIYTGDDKYDVSDVVTKSVTVSDVPSSVSVKVDDITYGDKAIVEVTVPSDATGNVTVTIDGKPYTAEVSDGKAIVVVPDLKAGNYTVDVSYSGDDKYESSSNAADLEVSKAKVDIKVIDQNNGTVTVVVPDNATGTVAIKVGGETYNATVENGVAVIELNNTEPGTYDIEAVYSGDENHTGASKDATVTAPKVNNPINVAVEDIKVGDTAEIVVTVPDDATGDVTIEIDGVEYTAPIKGGKATFSIDGLTAGNKTIAVDYVGDHKYVGNRTTGKIEVSKRESEVSATIADSNVGENVTVTVTVPSDATGQVLVDIDGVGYYVNVTDGTGTVEIPRIPSGVYNVTVTYTGDDKYLPSSNTTSFNVSKVESFVIPKAQDIYVGDNEEITISVPEDATGTVTLVIDGEEYDFDLDENKLSASEDSGNSYAVAVSYGKGRLTISGLPRGEYVVSARYNGDDKYLPSTNTTTFKVLKKSSKMDVTDLGNGTVVVDLPDGATGTVAIKVGDNTYNATVVDGKAVVDLTNETPGTHDIEVTYSGDDKYDSDVEDSKATIPRYDTPISVEVGDIDVGDAAVVTVTLPDDATGTVTIEINGKNYTADVKDGKAVFIVDGLEAGNKTVAVKYDGDDNYVSNSTTGQFTVSKVNSTIDASGKDITVGTDEVITVNVPSDATGRVLVEIDGVGYYGDIINGKAKIIIPELPSGEYTVTVNYEGDDKYLPSSTNASFTVTKAKTPISAIGDEITEGEDATVVVTVPEDATGTVTITVDGKEYTTEVVDGKAVFTVPDLNKGNYNVDVSYSGDKKYEANSTTTDIIVHAGSNGRDNVKHAGVDLTKHATGNPVLVLLLVILAIGSTQLRRFKE